MRARLLLTIDQLLDCRSRQGEIFVVSAASTSASSAARGTAHGVLLFV